jgi:type IV secretion system protein VirB9
MKSAIRAVRPALFASAMSLAILSSPVTAHTPHATSGSGAPKVNATAPVEPRVRVSHANAAARVQPDRSGYLGAIQQYAWAEGALFQIYAAPGQVTDIALQEGEELIGPGPVASGDTVRWIIGDTISGAGNTRRVHILVKPTRADIATNLVINTNRRTYHVELRATASTYMAAVSWIYTQDELIALRAAEAERERAAPVATVDFAALDFGYRISGDRPDWRPARVFDDGQQVFIEFDEGIVTGDMPPLFIIGEKGAAELVNYRVQGRYMIVDRLFDHAELRLGVGHKAREVRIKRTVTRRRSRQ